MNRPIGASRASLVRSYPPPPWTLSGSFLFAGFPVRAAAVADFAPSPLKLVSLPGGLALGAIGVGQYGPGSTLEYSELIAGVMVRHGLRPGLYVVHIGVDSLQSQQGGRELWRLPKQLWRFEWEIGPRQVGVRVWNGVTLVCTMSGAPRNARLWPLRASLNAFSGQGAAAGVFTSDCDLRVNRASWRLQIGPDGPLTAFAPAGPLLTAAGRGMATVQPLQPLDALPE